MLSTLPTAAAEPAYVQRTSVYRYQPVRHTIQRWTRNRLGKASGDVDSHSSSPRSSRLRVCQPGPHRKHAGQRTRLYPQMGHISHFRESLLGATEAVPVASTRTRGLWQTVEQMYRGAGGADVSRPPPNCRHGPDRPFTSDNWRFNARISDPRAAPMKALVDTIGKELCNM